MDRDYEHDDEGVNGQTNGYRRASQRQLEKAPEARRPHSVEHSRSYLYSNGGSTVRGVSHADHYDDEGESTESHTGESLGAPGPAPTESKLAEEM